MKNIARRTVVLFALILLCAAGTAHSAGVDMKEGRLGDLLRDVHDDGGDVDAVHGPTR